MKVSISKSVARAFAVLELFRETRRPATATEVRRRLGCPHSSIVAVLYNLADLGYLSHDAESGLFFPTPKVWGMAEWLRPSARGPSKLAAMVDQVARDTGHTTALYSRVSLFLNTVIARTGDHPAAPGAPAGPGAALALSVPGLAILAQLDDDGVHAMLRGTGTWLSEAGAKSGFSPGRTLADVATVRQRGFAIGRHPTLHNTEVVAYPLCSPLDRGPMALAVSMPAVLPAARKAEVRGAMEFRLGQLTESAPTAADRERPAYHRPAHPPPQGPGRYGTEAAKAVLF